MKNLIIFALLIVCSTTFARSSLAVKNTHMVKDLVFSGSWNFFLAPKEKKVLVDEYLDCGYTTSLSSSCRNSALKVSKKILVKQSGMGQSKLVGRMMKVLDSKQSLLLLKLTTTESSQFYIYAFKNNPTLELDLVMEKLLLKLSSYTASEVFTEIENLLDLEKIAKLNRLIITSEFNFLNSYAMKNSFRSFFHWSNAAFSSGFFGSGIAAHFERIFKSASQTADSIYRPLITELAVKYAHKLNVVGTVVSDLKLQLLKMPYTKTKGKLAICLLQLESSANLESEDIKTVKKYMASNPVVSWLVKAVSLYSLHGKDFGTSTELSRFSSHQFWFVRLEVVKGLEKYDDQIANMTLLKLSTDTDQNVRDKSFELISKRKIDLDKENISSLIDGSKWRSRWALARSLQYVTGAGSDEALLRLASDSIDDVQKKALFSLKLRPSKIGDLNIKALINFSNTKSRVGLAKALNYMSGNEANFELLQLGSDRFSEVHRAALETIKNRKLDIEDTDISALSAQKNSNSRSHLAKTLEFVKGASADFTLLYLCLDSDFKVRSSALSSLSKRAFESENPEVLKLINNSKWQSRLGLAKALSFVVGKVSDEALLNLAVDTNASVRAQSLLSLKLRERKIEKMNFMNFIDYKNDVIRLNLVNAIDSFEILSANYSLVFLSTDTNISVRKRALELIRSRIPEIHTGDLLNFFDDQNIVSRKSLAKTLKYVTGKSADRALLSLNIDLESNVRQVAFESLRSRPIDSSGLNIKYYVSSSSPELRVSLALALSYVTGKNSITVLEELLLDSDPEVQATAKASLAVHGL
ncbi:hypothetical protein N9O57_00220 [bacterium]|nr:hypothetical protein [bacterium]